MLVTNAQPRNTYVLCSEVIHVTYLALTPSFHQCIQIFYFFVLWVQSREVTCYSFFSQNKTIMLLKVDLNLRPLWSSLVWPESNEKCQACCQLSYRGTCRIMLQTWKYFNVCLNFTTKGSKIQFLTNLHHNEPHRTNAKLILLKKHNFSYKALFLSKFVI